MMNLRVLEHDCLTIIIMPISLFTFKSPTLAPLYIPVYSLFDGYLYSLGTYVCVGTTIQEKGSNCFDRYLYSWVLVNDGYLCSRGYGSIWRVGT